MPSREKELRVVPTTAAPGATSPGLRVLKTVTATDGGKYVIPMPGLLPAGLHISFHPSGEIHLKGRDFETVARIDLQRVVSGLLTGSLDSTFVKLLRTPEPGKRALGVIVPPEFSDMVREEKTRVEIPADRLAESIQQVEFENTDRLASDLAWLRARGLIRRQSMVILSVDGNERRTVFINVFESEDFEHLPKEVPSAGVLKLTIEAALAQLRTYGGVMITFPSDAELEGLAEEAGLGDFFRDLKKFSEDPALKEFESTAQERINALDLEAMFGSALVGLIERPVLRPPPPATAVKVESATTISMDPKQKPRAVTRENQEL
ncbi:MAG: hypothetical protein ACLQD8_04335 [Thermoplasmata archaeon]